MSKPLKQQISEWVHSPTGLAEINRQLSSKKISLDQVGTGDVAAIKSEANQLRNILVARLHEAGLTSIGVEQIHIGELHQDNKDPMSFYVDLSIDSNDLRRPSLQPNRYPDGAYNIVTLFIRGWDSSPIYGYWASAGKNVRSRTHKDPEPIIEDAVNEFNVTHKLEATVMDKYRSQ